MASPPHTPESPSLAQLRAWARELGFDDIGVAPVALPKTADTLEDWMSRGYAGGMEWLERHRETRLDLSTRFPWARCVLVLRRSYAGVRQHDGLSRHVSIYAQAQDYHDILLPGLKELARRACDRWSPRGRWHAYVDTGPVLERQLAEAAGMGWLGKNTLLLSARGGSYSFLGVIVCEFEMRAEAKSSGGSCGSCDACQPACPTDAFVAPGVLDARRCISYLTIEHKGPIPRALRPAMGEWLFGCDLCQSACPFNRGASAVTAPEEFVAARLRRLDLGELLRMDGEAFRAEFRDTPLWRPRREGLLRNALVVVANAGRYDCVGEASALLGDSSAVLREAASFCLASLRASWRGNEAWESQPANEPDWSAARKAIETALACESIDWVAGGMREDLHRPA
jgi:epoxyqueuosine reductase